MLAPNGESDNPEIDSNDEEIISFMAQKAQFRYSDLVHEFEEKRGWNHSKLMKHWKYIKYKLELLDRVPNKKTGRDEYRIKDQSQRVGEKALLRTQTSNGELNKIEIPAEKFAMVADFIAKNSPDLWLTAAEKSVKGIETSEKKKLTLPNGLKTASEEPETVIYDATVNVTNRWKSELEAEKKKRGILGKIKPSKGSPAEVDIRSFADVYKVLFSLVYTHYLEENKRKYELRKLFEKVKIQILTSPGETVPLFTEEDIANLIGVVLPKFMDENKGKLREKPFQLVISFPIL